MGYALFSFFLKKKLKKEEEDTNGVIFIKIKKMKVKFEKEKYDEIKKDNF